MTEELKNLKSLHVLSASIRIRKCTCHSEDRQTVNKVTLTAAKPQPNKNEVKRPLSSLKVNNRTKRWYNMTKRWYQVTKRWYNKTKRSILFSLTAATIAHLSQSDPNSAYHCYGSTDTKTRGTRKKKQINYYYRNK